MKLLIHAINGVGLGHVIRTRHIADAFQKLPLDGEIIFVTNTKYDEYLKKNYKTYALKKDTREVLQGRYTYDEYLKYNAMAIAKIIAHEKPDMMLFDCELNQELLLLCQRNSIKMAYVLRAVSPQRFSEIKNYLALFDIIIVPHQENELPSDQRDFLLNLSSVFVGPIIGEYCSMPNDERKNILITFGSGADITENQPLFLAVDEFLVFLRENNFCIDGIGVNVDIVTGPFYEETCYLDGFGVRETTDNLMENMCRSKVVISGGGYNTTNEILSTKTPAVVIPLERAWDDQFKRAETLVQLGCIRVAQTGIIEEVRSILNDWQSYHKKFPTIEGGNIQAVKALVEVLDDKG